MTDMLNKVIFLVILFLANAIQAITGFAGTVLAMPPSMLLIGVENAKTVLNVMAWLSCLWITLQNMKYIRFKELGKIILFMSVGMVAGLQILKIFPSPILLKIYGIVILAIALKNLLVKKEKKLSNIVLIIVLLVSGVIHGMFVSGGALLVVYASQVLRDKDEFRATIAPVWVILNTFMGIQQLQSGYFTKEVLILIGVSIVPLFAAVLLGNWLQKKINQKTFLKMTYILLAISGLSVIL